MEQGLLNRQIPIIPSSPCTSTQSQVSLLSPTHQHEQSSENSRFRRAVVACPKPIVMSEFQPQYVMKSGLNWSCEEFVSALSEYWRNEEKSVIRRLQFFYLTVDPFEENRVPIRTLCGLLLFEQKNCLEECVEIACGNKGAVVKEELLAFAEKMEYFLEEFSTCTVGQIVGV